jgi:hypothetical protein
MSTQDAKNRLELLQATVDLLILRTLIFGLQHGQGIARIIQQNSDKELLVEHSALYPALQRLEERGWISAKWGTSSKQSQGAVLCADVCWTQTAGEGNDKVETADGRDWADSRSEAEGG